MFLTFSNTILLIGLAGAVVPLVLHLLSRARYQTVDWGAMIFLQGAEGRPQHRAKLGQFLLLAVRMAVVGVLAIALAEPVLQHWSPEADSTGAALRAANRGELLSLGGAVASGAAIVIVMILAGASIKESGVRWWHGLFAVG
ncbi:MAG TPA: BatA domain-containing protein, partial [Tepidisphaeraceae bacterium]|nr:BatA domain-containing protein [Tepidisphaeraceae bacterium]